MIAVDRLATAALNCPWRALQSVCVCPLCVCISGWVNLVEVRGADKLPSLEEEVKLTALFSAAGLETLISECLMVGLV